MPPFRYPTLYIDQMLSMLYTPSPLLSKCERCFTTGFNTGDRKPKPCGEVTRKNFTASSLRLIEKHLCIFILNFNSYMFSEGY